MSQIAQVKAATDIVAVVSERVTLKPAGSYLKGLCPFHSEKSPSFFVSPIVQRYKCYGCGEGGDVISFLQKYENITFYEALQELAERAGITLESETRTGADDERQKILEVLALTKDYYHYVLTEHKAGTTARAYLKQRGVTAESITVFQLGFALPAWDGLLTYLHKKKKYPVALLEQAGLIIPGKYGRSYDRFRDRVMFPLRDHRGRVVGFSGRTLAADVKEAKYINSPETAVYHKSKLLFGFSELHKEIQKKRQVIITEGEFDVISSTQAGVNNVVAIKGSVLTPDHAQLISRVADQVILALDTDSAGVEATRRSIGVLKAQELELRIAQLSAGKDPDELARQSPAAWRKAVAAAVSGYEFLLQAALQAHDISTPAGKRQCLKELAVPFSEIESAVEQEFYIKRLATHLGVSAKLVAQDIALFAQKRSSSAVTQEKRGGVDATPPPLSRLDQLETVLLYILFQTEDEQVFILWNQVSELAEYLPLVQALKDQIGELPSQIHWPSLLQKLSADTAQQVMEAITRPGLQELKTPAQRQAEWQRALTQTQAEVRRLRRSRIADQLAQLDALAELSAKQQAKQAQLLQELTALN